MLDRASEFLTRRAIVPGRDHVAQAGVAQGAAGRDQGAITPGRRRAGLGHAGFPYIYGRDAVHVRSIRSVYTTLDAAPRDARARAPAGVLRDGAADGRARVRGGRRPARDSASATCPIGHRASSTALREARSAGTSIRTRTPDFSDAETEGRHRLRARHLGRRWARGVQASRCASRPTARSRCSVGHAKISARHAHVRRGDRRPRSSACDSGSHAAIGRSTYGSCQRLGRQHDRASLAPAVKHAAFNARKRCSRRWRR
jgi:hypothetical protein